MDDRDMGEMFLKLMTGNEVRPYYGLDITNISSENHQEWEDSRKSNWVLWKIK